MQGPCSDRWQLWINTGLRHTPWCPKPRLDTGYQSNMVQGIGVQNTWYLDGATYEGQWKDLARAGWAVVLTKVVEGGMVKVGTVLGHLPGYHQDNYRAEVYALSMAISVILEHGYEGCGVLLVTDCLGVCKVWNSGGLPHFMDAAADLWRNIRQGHKQCTE